MVRDLMIAIPGENATAGAFAVLFGTDDGLTADGNQLLDRDTPGVRGESSTGDFFGNFFA